MYAVSREQGFIDHLCTVLFHGEELLESAVPSLVRFVCSWPGASFADKSRYMTLTPRVSEYRYDR